MASKQCYRCEGLPSTLQMPGLAFLSRKPLPIIFALNEHSLFLRSCNLEAEVVLL